MHCYKVLSHGSAGQTWTKEAQSVEATLLLTVVAPDAAAPADQCTRARRARATATHHPLPTGFRRPASGLRQLGSRSGGECPFDSLSRSPPPVDELQLAKQCGAVRRHDRVELIYPRMRHLLSVTSEPIAWQVRFHRRGASRRRLAVAERGDDESLQCSGRTPSTRPSTPD